MTNKEKQVITRKAKKQGLSFDDVITLYQVARNDDKTQSFCRFSARNYVINLGLI